MFSFQVDDCYLLSYVEVYRKSLCRRQVARTRLHDATSPTDVKVARPKFTTSSLCVLLTFFYVYLVNKWTHSQVKLISIKNIQIEVTSDFWSTFRHGW